MCGESCSPCSPCPPLLGQGSVQTLTLYVSGYVCNSHPAKKSQRSFARIQFHVDKLSSAHIYLRLREGESWDNIPEELLTDLAQLTKANSIEGRAERPRGSPLSY